jgi:hypothetical protein
MPMASTLSEMKSSPRTRSRRFPLVWVAVRSGYFLASMSCRSHVLRNLANCGRVVRDWHPCLVVCGVAGYVWLGQKENGFEGLGYCDQPHNRSYQYCCITIVPGPAVARDALHGW